MQLRRWDGARLVPDPRSLRWPPGSNSPLSRWSSTPEEPASWADPARSSTAVGVLILTVIANGFNLMGWDTTYQQVVTGALILIAVAADSLIVQRLRKR